MDQVVRISSKDFVARREVGGAGGPAVVVDAVAAAEEEAGWVDVRGAPPAPKRDVLVGPVADVVAAGCKVLGVAPNKDGVDADVAAGCEVAVAAPPNSEGAEVAAVDAG